MFYTIFVLHYFTLLLIYTIVLPVSVIAERCHHADDCHLTVCSANSSHVACHQDRCTCDAVIGEYPGSGLYCHVFSYCHVLRYKPSGP